MVNILVFYTGEKPWNAARQLSQLVEVDERFESYFHDYKMNLIEITGNTSYNFLSLTARKEIKWSKALV